MNQSTIFKQVIEKYILYKAKPYVMADSLVPFQQEVLVPNIRYIPPEFDTIICEISKREKSPEDVLGWVECFFGPNFCKMVFEHYAVGDRCNRSIFSFMLSLEIAKKFFIEYGMNECGLWPNGQIFIDAIDKRMKTFIDICKQEPDNEVELQTCLIFISKTYSEFYNLATNSKIEEKILTHDEEPNFPPHFVL
jgi:hypothetical protein